MHVSCVSSMTVRHRSRLLTEKKIQAFETTFLRKLLRISYFEHKTNDRAQDEINFLLGLEETLLATVKRRRLTSVSGASKTVIPKPSLRHLRGWATPWSAEKNAGRTTPKARCLCPCRNYSQWWWWWFFSSLSRISGECLTIHSPPAHFFFFLKWRLARAH